MNEAQTRKDFIDPVLEAAGWNCAPARIVVEQITNGRLTATGGHEKPKKADYVLMWGTRRIAVVEAKAKKYAATKGEPQAREYAEALGVRFTFATNGDQLVAIDLLKKTRKIVPLSAFPSPETLLAALAEEQESPLEEACRRIPWDQKRGRAIRYYQERAAEAVFKAMGEGKKRMLLTLATGTGKTYIAFQIVHKLLEVKWSLSGLGARLPRVLFLTHRNFLATDAKQAFDLEHGATFRWEAKTEHLSMGYQVYFSIYQTLLGGDDTEDADMEIAPKVGAETRYQKLPQDFFDFIIVDECHYGSSNAESQWRKILEHFSGAVHLGLTATPKCEDNTDTYKYFGKPVYTYSLRKGIEDGFLSPFRVRKIDSTLKTYTRDASDVISEPEAVDEETEYANRAIYRNHFEIAKRDEHFIDALLRAGFDWTGKTIVFCETQEHAYRMALQLQAKAEQLGVTTNKDFCVRVTSDDGADGDKMLKLFQTIDEKIPMILTTSEKLTTGVDARDVRAIVLLRQVKSMVSFKQIIGRGTRLCEEEGKGYFTIYDFFDNTDNFFTEEWDGEPVCPKCGEAPCVCEKGTSSGGQGSGTGCGNGGQTTEPCATCGCRPCICAKESPKTVEIELGDGHVIEATNTEFIYFGGKPMEVKAFILHFVKTVRQLVTDVMELKREWIGLETRNQLLDALAESGFNADALKRLAILVQRANYDVLDVMLDLAYHVEPLAREIRVIRAEQWASRWNEELEKLAGFILDRYQKEGVWSFNQQQYGAFLKQQYGSPREAYQRLQLSGAKEANAFYANLQKALYDT